MFSGKPLDVLVLMGSQSDAATMKEAVGLLRLLDVCCEDYIASAHRAPDKVKELVEDAVARGVKAIIAAAGMSAMLPGAASSHTYTVPVFGVAVEGRGDFDNFAAISAISNMPPGVPVGFCGLGKSGAINAVLMAASVVAGNRPEVVALLASYREREAKKRGFGKPDYNPVLAKA